VVGKKKILILYSPAILWTNRLVKFGDKIPPLGEVVLPRPAPQYCGATGG